MGSSYCFHCRKCGNQEEFYLSVGFRFPDTYRRTVSEAKKGSYGKELRDFFAEHPDGVLDCDRVLLQCTECGALETGTDLSTYVRKPDLQAREKGRWSVAFPFEGEEYVAPWDLKNYKLVAHYEHTCEKCGSKMKTIKEDEIEEMYGDRGSFNPSRPKETGFACPVCKEPLWYVYRGLWD